MAGDVDIPFSSMQTLSNSLTRIIAEFDDADERTTELLDAIDRPQDRDELRDAAEDFESRWDDKRETLRRKLESLLERVDETKSAWEELDLELQQMQESSE